MATARREPERTYGHFCALAKALDIVGERWTLLIVRELAFGARRFSELERGVAGISTAVLAARLRRLEDAAVIERRELPPPGAGYVYRLTKSGRELGRAIVPLAVWGTRWLDRPELGEAFRPAWPLLYLQATLDPSRTRGVHETFEVHVDDSVVSVSVADGKLVAREGPAPGTPDVMLACDTETFLEVVLGRLDPMEAESTGRLVAEGPRAAVRRSAALLRGIVGGTRT